MQAEIFDNGDFEYRYDLSRISDMDALTNVVIGAKFGTNELGDVSWLLDGTNTVMSIRLHRLSEFDWDGDGLANDIDPDPYTSNGDCHGQGEGWVLASFTNSAEIISADGYTNRQSVVVRYDPDPEPLPHVTLSSPNTIFVNDDDDNHNGTNDYLDAGCAFTNPDDDIVPVVVEFKSLAYVTNGTLRLSAQGLRIWEDQNHNGTSAQSLTMTNCATPFERTLYVERDSLLHSQVDECRLALEWLECTDSTIG